MPQSPLPSNESDRLASLRRYAILDTPPEAAFDRIADFAARLFSVPAALVTLVDEDRAWFKSCRGFCQDSIPSEISRGFSFCSYTILSREALVVEDARLDARFADNVWVAGEARLRFYAGGPLVMADGTVLGSLCLVDFQPRTFSAEQAHCLQDLAASVVAELELRRTQLELRRALDGAEQRECVHRQMFDASPQPMWVYDNRNWRFLAVNDSTIAHFGYSRAEFLSMTLFDIRPPEDADALRRTLETHGDGTRRVGLRLCVKKDGSRVWMDVASHAVQFEEYDARLAVAVDVTERQVAEDALHQSIAVLNAQQKATQDGILIVDEQGFIVSYNHNLCTLFQMPPELLQPGEDDRLFDFCLPQLKHQEAALQKYRQLMACPAEHSHDEIEMRDGRIIECRSDPFLSEAGRLQGRVLSFRDITERCRMEKALRQSEQTLALHIRHMPLAAIEIALDKTVTSWNPAAEQTFGYTAAEAVGKSVLDLVVPEEGHAHVEDLRVGLLTQTGGTRSTNYNRTKLGKIILCDWYNTPLVDETGQIIGFASLARDITEEARAQERMRRSEAHKAAILDTANDCIISINGQGRIMDWNPAAERTFGYARAEALGNLITDLILPLSAREAYRQGLARHLASGEWPALTQRIELLAQRRNGVQFHAELTATAHTSETETLYTLFLRDITERKVMELEREELLAQTEFLLADALERADHDPLTGLLNHRAFHKRLKEDVDDARLSDRRGAVLLVDLNNFKFFNDAYGHLAGDDVLRQVAQAFGATCRAQDTLARYGGDEFAVLLPGASRAEAQVLAEDLRDAASLVGYHPPGYETPIPFSLSVGIACFPEDAATRTALLEAADAQLRISKSGGDDDSHALEVRRTLARSVGGFTMLDALVTAVDNKDRYTRRHSEDVMHYSLQIAQELKMDVEMQRRIEIAALLHDVGKIGVPDAVLRKPGRLSQDDYEAIKQHPMMGSVIVGSVAGFEEVLDAVRHHHERWDGGGYPFGLRGEETPLPARLMAVADAYSAMTTDRPYRKGMEPQKALRILEDGSGTQWDPACVRAFLAVRRRMDPQVRLAGTQGPGGFRVTPAG